jgi:DNA-binding GntR family transcriptional regulator
MHVQRPGQGHLHLQHRFQQQPVPLLTTYGDASGHPTRIHKETSARRVETGSPDLLYALIVEKYGIPVVRAEETLTAGAADTNTAAVLGIDPGAPVLVLNRETYTTNNCIIETRVSKGRADKFSYKTETR